MLQLLKFRIVRALGGYPTIDDAIDAIQRLELPDRRKVLTLAVRRLYNTIGPEDILRETPEGQWISEGKQLSDGTRKLLVAEAKQFSESKLWEVLQRDVRYQANRRMFLIGKSETDLIVGKLWLYSFDAIRTRLESMAGGRGSFNIKQG